MNCSICSSKNVVSFLQLYDDRFGYPGIFSVLRCIDCGHKSLDSKFTSQELTQLYTDFYPRSQLSVDGFQPYVERSGFLAWLDGVKYSAFRWVPRKVRILDIGCGFGETLGYHKARDCDVYGVEADENIRRVADKFGYKVNIGLFDSGNYEENFFDYVTMDQVLEHVTNPLEVLQGVSKVMKSSGYLIVSTPNANGWGAKFFGRRWINWHIPYHLHFFSEKSIRLVAEQAGLVLERIETETCSDWLYMQWNQLLTLPEIGENSIFWKPQEKRTFAQKFLKRVLLLIHWTKINHVITRVFDALGLGDNYIFLLRKMNR